MNNFALPLLLCFGLAAAGINRPGPNPEALKHFQVLTVPQIGGSWVQQYEFVVSTASNHWATSAELCKSLGEHYDLVSIETPQKGTSLLNLLNYYGVDYFWTGGNWNQAQSKLVWANPDVPVNETWAPWHQGTPQPTINTRLSYQKTFGLATWKRNADGAASKRCICEPVELSRAPPCYQDADLIVLMDSSGSISPSDYQLGLQFASDVAGAWRTYGGTRMGWTTFGHGANRIFELNTSLSRSQSQAMIQTTPYLGQGTRTDLALDDAFLEYTSSPRAVDVKNVLTITDGMSTAPNFTIESAARLKVAGYRMFAVGVGNYSPTELLTLAGGDSSRVFTVTQFSEIMDVLRPVCVKLCE